MTPQQRAVEAILSGDEERIAAVMRELADGILLESVTLSYLAGLGGPESREAFVDALARVLTSGAIIGVEAKETQECCS